MTGAVLTLGISGWRRPNSVKFAAGVALGYCSHLAMDAVPHIEPSVIQKASFVIPGTVSFYCAILDNVCGAILLACWMRAIPLLCQSWWLLAAALIGAWGPDAIMAGTMSNLLRSPIWQRLTFVHRLTHDWWLPFLSDQTIRLTKLTFGSAITVTFFITTQRWLYRFRRELPIPATSGILLPEPVVD